MAKHPLFLAEASHCCFLYTRCIAFFYCHHDGERQDPLGIVNLNGRTLMANGNRFWNANSICLFLSKRNLFCLTCCQNVEMSKLNPFFLKMLDNLNLFKNVKYMPAMQKILFNLKNSDCVSTRLCVNLKILRCFVNCKASCHFYSTIRKFCGDFHSFVYSLVELQYRFSPTGTKASSRVYLKDHSSFSGIDK